MEEAISGAKDIVAESISDKADYRSEIRERTFRKGMLVSTAKNRKRRLFMRNIMNMKNVWKKCQDTGCLLLIVERKRSF